MAGVDNKYEFSRQGEVCQFFVFVFNYVLKKDSIGFFGYEI